MREREKGGGSVRGSKRGRERERERENKRERKRGVNIEKKQKGNKQKSIYKS